MENVTKLNFREKEQLLYHIGRLYRKGILYTTLQLQGMIENCEENASAIEFSSHVRLTLQQMKREDAVIVINNFLEIKNKNWWKSQYTPYMYHCKKKTALNEFISSLFIENGNNSIR